MILSGLRRRRSCPRSFHHRVGVSAPVAPTARADHQSAHPPWKLSEEVDEEQQCAC